MDYQTAGDRIREVRAHMGARGWVAVVRHSSNCRV
jgi:hypothetical protein